MATKENTMQLTYKIMLAISQDAGNKHMKQHGRDVWNADDYAVACDTFSKLLAQS